MELPEEVRLLHPSNESYRHFCRSHRIRTSHGRPRDTLARDYGRSLARAENALRTVLAQHLPSTDQRILRYTSSNWLGRVAPAYRELDFVVGEADAPSCFIETKFRSRTGRPGSGVKQVREAVMTARSRWPGVGGLCVNVFTGAVFGDEAVEPPALSPIACIAQLAAAAERRPEVSVVWVSGRDFIEQAVALGVLDEAFLEGIRMQGRSVRDPVSTLQSRAIPASTNLGVLLERLRMSPAGGGAAMAGSLTPVTLGTTGVRLAMASATPSPDCRRQPSTHRDGRCITVAIR
jgi:hypothetical protein